MAEAVSLEKLLSTVDTSPDAFLEPSASLQAASLAAAKEILDPVISRYSVFKEVALKGLDVEQIWEQVRLVEERVKETLGKQRGLKGAVSANGRVGSESGSAIEEDDEESNIQDDDEEASQDEESQNVESGKEDGEEDGEDEDEGPEENDDEFPANPELDDDSVDKEIMTKEVPSKSFKKDVHGLNDEFFSIDDFNRLTEHQEVEESDDGNGEEIDYFEG